MKNMKNIWLAACCSAVFLLSACDDSSPEGIVRKFKADSPQQVVQRVLDSQIDAAQIQAECFENARKSQTCMWDYKEQVQIIHEQVEGDKAVVVVWIPSCGGIANVFSNEVKFRKVQYDLLKLNRVWKIISVKTID